ncbi:hypothetical protein [Bradyrhizobium sp. CCBAU 45389]|uniref:hypothetical protein n=1 Tax=Bradyrhizobium sp. CCBAU 45389 TaxID=858429 RepID=UPI0023050E08|nr:hypothetical protein [Bradyrhizobium sp. CCBAU 45389]
MRIEFCALLARHAVLLMLFVLGGCATLARDDVADSHVAQRQPGSSTVHDYLPVHDLPPQRDEPLIPAGEQDRIKTELTAAQRQAQRVSAKPK